MAQARSAPSAPLAPFSAVLLTVVGIVAMFGGSVLAARSGLTLRGTVALGTLLLAAPALIAVLARRDVREAAIGRRLPGPPLVLSLLLGATLWLASLGLIELQSLLMPPTPEYLRFFRAIHAALTPSGPLDAIVSILVIAILPGICEELVVRGVLLPSLADRMARPLAVALSALLFAAIHYDRYRFLFAFVLGVVFGYVRLRTGSLWPSVVAHTAINTLTFALAPYFDDPSKPYTPQPWLGLACLVTGSAIATPVWRRLCRRPTEGH